MNDTTNETPTTDTPTPLTRSLPCPLSQAELADMGDRIDVLIGEAEDLELAAKSSASDFRARLSRTAEMIARLSRQRRGRVIDRDVEVTVTQDLARAEEVIRRLDTGEIVSKRTLSRAELEKLRQLEIPSVSESGHPAPKPEGDPWADTPAELAPLLCLLDGDEADLSVIGMAELKAIALYAREKSIPAADPRRRTIGVELAARKRANRTAAGMS